MDTRFIFVLVGVLCKTVVFAGVTVEIKMVAFVNPKGKGSNGQCCDGKWGICGSACDHRFTMCLDKVGGNNNIKECPYGSYRSSEISNANTIMFGSSFGGIKNPLIFNMDSWPGKVKFKVDVWDADHNDDDEVDFIVGTISQNATTNGRPGPAVFYIMEKRTKLRVSVKVYCNENYYGQTCETYCKPRNDSIGHYRCNKLGQWECLPGWNGTYCDDNGVNECETSNPCNESHVCLDLPSGYNCTCPVGKSGPSCEHIDFTCDSNPCENGGNCSTSTNGTVQCLCQKGWTGLLCSELVDHCKNNPCLNGGLCIQERFGFICVCHSNSSGETCEDFLTPTTTTTLATTTSEKLTSTVSDNFTSSTVSTSTENYTRASEQTPTTELPSTTKDIHAPAVLVLKGRVVDNNKEEIIKGVTRILRELMNVKGPIQLQLQYIVHVRPTGEVVTEVHVSGTDNGQPMNNAKIEEIFNYSDKKVLEEYIPLPIYRPSPSAQASVQQHDSWIHSNWWIVLLGFIVVIGLIICVATFAVYRRKKSFKGEKNNAVARPTSAVADAIPAQSFENSLYFEMNNQNQQKRNSRSEPKVSYHPGA